MDKPRHAPDQVARRRRRRDDPGAMKPAIATTSTAATVSNDSTSWVFLPCKVPVKLMPVTISTPITA